MHAVPADSPGNVSAGCHTQQERGPDMNYSQFIPQSDIYLFNTGNAQRAYLMFGCHFIPELNAHRFAVWAPNASAVSVVGDFNSWDPDACPMEKQEGGVFIAFVPGLKNGDTYKYLICGYDGQKHYKADPFAFYAELRPNTASRVWSLDGYTWSDQKFQETRRKTTWFRKPVSIYEMHLGSWRQRPDGSFYTYRELADDLAEYLKKMGFTHVELLPITEYPFDGSWGYQVTGYYAVTSRYGTPQDFMYFVDVMHQNGIGVLLDWVPGHFPRDEHGLRRFDGTALFEHEDPRQGEQPQWGTMLFNYGRPEVQSFLLSNAMFFMDVYHIDGLRIDAVSSMLYLNFGKEEGQYVKNKYGGNENLEAIELLKRVNSTVLSQYPGTMMIAEESSAYPLVTKPPYDGGLGFTFKWDMGFMNDMLKYMETDHLFKKYKHNNVTFSMQYAFSENYVLAFSHDEVVHGKHSMVDKMFGDYWQKFAGLRAFYGYLFAHPGKKLLFMGDEFAQFIEWNFAKELDWFLLEYDSHRLMSVYVQKLNKFYQKHRALYEIEDSWDGFRWLSVDDRDNSVIAFLRISTPRRGKTQQIVCLTNFTPVVRAGYRLALPGPGTLRQLINSDDIQFGGSGVTNPAELSSSGTPFLGLPDSAVVTAPPLSTVYFEFIPQPEDDTAHTTPLMDYRR